MRISLQTVKFATCRGGTIQPVNKIDDKTLL